MIRRENPKLEALRLQSLATAVMVVGTGRVILAHGLLNACPPVGATEVGHLDEFPLT